MRFYISFFLAFFLTGCSGGLSVANTAPPTVTPLPSVVTPSPSFTAVATATSAPSIVPSSTPIVTQTPEAIVEFVAQEPIEQIFYTIWTSDGFVTVRDRPSTKGASVQRLDPGTQVRCVGFVEGETLQFGGPASDQWADCPSVNGYIFAQLLEDAYTPPPTQRPNNDMDSIVAAVRAHVGQLGFNYSVENICIDRGYATAAVVAENGYTDTALAALQHNGSRWVVVFFGPGYAFAISEGANLGFPTDFGC